jgi:ribosomal RNA-processing protein 12
VVLSAVETTLREQGASFTPTAYFAALLALLGQSISQGVEISNRDLATAVIYLLDAVTAFTPHSILRSKFQQILAFLVIPLSHKDAEAPITKSAIGCLESLLIGQDSASWALPQSQASPRAALAVLLNLGLDPRPKVRKRVLEALTNILQNGPPSPSVDHPAADLCAQTALRSLSTLSVTAGAAKKNRGHGETPNDPALMHSLQLVKTVATASRGWPSKKLESLCETLLDISKSNNEFLALAAFEIFEIIFEGMTGAMTSAKLPRLLEVISDLRPSQNDSQLLPPWIAVISRGYDVLAQVEPEDAFQKLPELFNMLTGFMASSSHNIRISASECLVSFLANCIPESVILEPSVYDGKALEKLARTATGMLSIKYQAAWMEVFNVIGAMFDTLRWRADPVLNEAIKFVGDLRSNDSFNGKKEADEVLGKAVRAIGPEAFLNLLPLNLVKPQPGQPGRAWLLPILREYTGNTRLAHFRSEFVPLSEAIFQRVLDNGSSEKTMEVKIFEILVQQIWALFPGYCDLPVDLVEVSWTKSFHSILIFLVIRSKSCRTLGQLALPTN